MTNLHYIFDPLCGWCYGAAPLIEAARGIADLKIIFHAGGMMAGSNRRKITEQWREYVTPHDRRIAELTGQPFGEAYFDGLLRDTGAIMDSAPPTTAILAAEHLAGRGLDMLHRLQKAHYAEGQRIADTAVLRALATELGLDPALFAEAYASLEGQATEQHFADSRAWLARAGADGFPTLALETADGMLARLDVGAWLGQPVAWASHLRELVPMPTDVTQAPVNPTCSIDGCAI